MYCEKDKLTLFSLALLKKIQATKYSWYWLTNGYIGAHCIDNGKHGIRYLHQLVT